MVPRLSRKRLEEAMKAHDATSVVDSAAPQAPRVRLAPMTDAAPQPKLFVNLGLFLLFVMLGTLYGAIISAGIAPANPRLAKRNSASETRRARRLSATR
jgi:anti-sigma factor RsiW